MAGISSKALAFGEPGNKLKFGDKELQNKEFSDGYGLETYDFDARMYDPQVGRMWQVDPWVEKYERQSPYVGFNDNPIIFADPTGKGGELTVKTRKNGTIYVEISSTIYVYSSDPNIDVRCYASKIQCDIMSQWNNPVGKGYAQVGTKNADVVFNVTVHAISLEQAEAMAPSNKNSAINFMALLNDGKGSKALGNSGRFDIADLDKYGTTTAAHEYGHLLGYHLEKGFDKNTNERILGQMDDEDHADRSNSEERGYIMSRIHGGADHSKRRVHAIEYARLGGGISRRNENVSESEGSRVGYGGLYTPRDSKQPIPIVNPHKPITNEIFK